ncbi:unnamed protein product [Arctia plantaginis]|uniref:Proline-rich protein PRCC n=1 Tax=Arctia plantaginis TaxID=874455 RepID=A0A8S0ZXN1_ARCPL|nr:unnamed protein product [Arctia plantaginis]
MALVAYDNSDSSECEDEDNETPPVVLVNNKTESKSSLKLPEPVQLQTATKIDEEPEVGDSENLFKLLPQRSRKKPAVIEEDDEFLHKKEVSNGVKPKAKITVPSLNDFKDVETSAPIAKPRVTNGKKSGLLSMLPQPRNGVTTTTRSLIPNVLTKKPSTASVAKKNQAPVTATKNNLNPKPLINDYSDESDNEEVENDFFSINKPVELPTDVGMPLDVEPNTSTNTNTQKPRGIESFFKKEEVKPIELDPDYDSNSIADQSEAGSSYNGYGSENSNSNEVLLDDEAIMKLCGSRGKRKREEIQIVDVNQKDVLADAREMLLKGLMDDTTKRVSASKKKGNEPTSQQRRKHQITYLAYQAKANEAELQNQWANNKMSKRQTQAKYGF